MSKHSFVKTQMTDFECVTAAFELMFPGKVQVAVNPFLNELTACDYHGAKQAAALVVPRSATSEYSDLGVSYQPDGTFTMIVDDLSHFDTKALEVQYNVAAVRKLYPGHNIVQTIQPNGDVVLELEVMA